MNLNPGISRINVLSTFGLQFAVVLFAYLNFSITTYLLVADYGIAQSDSGKVAGRLALYITFAVLPAEALLGTLMDIFGRKNMIWVGTVLVGVCLILKTLFTQVYPALLIVSIISSIAYIPTYAAPLTNDYLNPNSFGVYGAWSSLISFVSQTVATSGTIKM